MKVSKMIEMLAQLQDRVGDVDVLVTDGHECRFYSGDFELFSWEEDGTTYIDIGVGGCEVPI
jgi:hypothetical protein